MLSALQFLDECLVPPRRFKNAAKEQAYAKFHQACLINMSTVASVTTTTVATWLCLKTFDILVQLNYEAETQSQSSAEIQQSPPLLEAEHDIVQYIGGAVIQKMQKKPRNLKDQDAASIVRKCLEELTCCDSDTTPSATYTSTTHPKTLTNILDRGGLIKLKPNSLQIFLDLELTFRNLFGGSKITQASFDTFFDKCCEMESVSTCFYDIMDVPEGRKKTF